MLFALCLPTKDAWLRALSLGCPTAIVPIGAVTAAVGNVEVWVATAAPASVVAPASMAMAIVAVKVDVPVEGAAPGAAAPN